MLDNVLPKLEQLTEQLLDKNQHLNQENTRLSQETEQLNEQIKRLTDENETLQLEVFEQEEKHSGSLNRINTLLQRLEQEA